MNSNLAGEAFDTLERWVQGLEHRVKALENPQGFPMYTEPLTSAVGERDNMPCYTVEEIFKQRTDKLVAYFEKRAKENLKRAEKAEKNAECCRAGLYMKTAEKESQSGYYFSGKADSYQRAAAKIREILGNIQPPAMFTAPEVWIVENRRKNDRDCWERSKDLGIQGEFPSKTAAMTAIADNYFSKNPSCAIERRARRTQ